MSFFPKIAHEQDRIINNSSIILQSISCSTYDKSDLEIFDNDGVARNAKRWKNLQEFLHQFHVYTSNEKPGHVLVVVYISNFCMFTSTGYFRSCASSQVSYGRPRRFSSRSAISPQ